MNTDESTRQADRRRARWGTFIRSALLSAILLSACLTVAGCTYAPEIGREVPDDRLVHLRPGFSRRSDVLATLGPPQRTVHSPAGTILIYYHADGGLSFCGLPLRGTECEILMVTLKDGKVSRYSYQ